MKHNTEAELIGDIIKTIDFKFDNDIETKKQELMSKWQEVVEEKLVRYSKPAEIDDFGVMRVVCKNSVVSNELFNKRIQINERLKSFAKEIGLEFRYIKLTK